MIFYSIPTAFSVLYCNYTALATHVSRGRVASSGSQHMTNFRIIDLILGQILTRKLVNSFGFEFKVYGILFSLNFLTATPRLPSQELFHFPTLVGPSICVSDTLSEYKLALHLRSGQPSCCETRLPQVLEHELGGLPYRRLSAPTRAQVEPCANIIATEQSGFARGNLIRWAYLALISSVSNRGRTKLGYAFVRPKGGWGSSWSV